METQAPLDPRLALDEAARAHAALALRARAPGWYHAVLGLMIGALLASMAGPTWLMLATDALFCLGLVLMIAAYRRHTGMWINGYRAGRTRVVAFATAFLAAGIMLACVWAKTERGLWLSPLIGAPVVAALVTAAGYIWERAYRADLADEARAGDRP